MYKTLTLNLDGLSKKDEINQYYSLHIFFMNRINFTNINLYYTFIQ